MFAEHGLNQNKIPAEDHWRERIPNHFTIIGYNKTELERAGQQQYGGTGIVSKSEITARKISHGHDESGLGRWTWIRTQGKNQKFVRFISAYRPVDNKIGESSVWNQHMRFWTEEGRKIDPIQAFDDDLITELTTWFNEGDTLILGMDYNTDIRQGPLQAAFKELNMKEGILTNHPGKSPPATQNTNRTRTPIDGIWMSAGIDVLASGYWEFGGACPSDHRGLWIDVDKDSVLGHRPNQLYAPAIQRLSETDPRIKRRYIRRTKEAYKDNNIYEKFEHLQRLYQDKDEPDFDQIKFADKYDLLDIEIKVIRKDIERNIRKVKRGNIQWSPALQTKRDQIELWQRVVKREQGIATSRTTIRRLIKKTGDTEAKQADLSTAVEKIKKAFQEYYSFKPHALESRQGHTQRLADALAEENNTTRAKEIKKLRLHEKQRKNGRIAKIIRGKGLKNPVIKVTSQDTDGTIIEHTDQNSITDACTQSNLK